MSQDKTSHAESGSVGADSAPQDTTTAAASTGAIGSESPDAPQGAWARFAHDASERPRFYLAIVGVAAVLALAFFYYRQASASSAAETEQAFREELAEASTGLQGPDIDEDEQLRQLRGLLERIEAAPTDALKYAGYNSAVQAASNLVRTSSSPAKRMEFLKLTISAGKRWKELSPASMALPIDPVAGDKRSQQELLLESAQAQLDYLKAQGAAEVKTEAVLLGSPRVVFTLGSDGAEATTALEMQLYGEESPFAAKHLLDSVAAGRWDGTRIFRLRAAQAAPEADPDSEEANEEKEPVQIIGFYLGSAFSRLAPERTELHGSEEDWVGYTVPVLRKSRVTPEAGSVGFRPRLENGAVVGLHPNQLIILTSDDDAPLRNVLWIGKLTDESLTAAEALLAGLVMPEDAAAGADASRFVEVPAAWVIRSSEVKGEGSISAPTYPVGEWRDPTVPGS